MSWMFNKCYNIINLNLSNFNTVNVADINHMFSNCNKLTTIYVSDLWNTNNVTDSSYMFYKCISLVGAVTFNSTKIDATMANYTTGYLTYKSNG